MEYELYKVAREEKLSELSQRFGLTDDQLKELNPTMRTFGGFPFGKVWVAVNQIIKVPVIKKEPAGSGEKRKISLVADDDDKYRNERVDFDFNKSQKERAERLSEQEKFIRNLTFDQKARYRCEQFNTTKVENNITFHCDTKKEYLLQTCLNEKDVVRVILKDYIYKINPQNFGYAIEATKELEFDKENVIFLLNEHNSIKKVLNYQAIKNKWEQFKPKLIETEFYKAIAKQNSNAASDIIKVGNLEFSTEENLRKTYDKGLFYHIMFSDFYADRVLKFLSQIFVNVELELYVSNSKKESENFVQYKTVGALQKEKLNMKILEEQYNKFYKPVILYGFTDYNYDYQITRNVNKNTGLITDARAVFTETIKNNYQIITQFDLKQVEL